MRRCLSLFVNNFRSLRDSSAALLGASFRDRMPRRACFLAVSAALFLAANLAPAGAGLGVVILALWLLGAVYWAWVINEKQRGRIAKKIDNTRPDDLPDLRDLALLTALVVPCFLPLLLETSQSCFGLFQIQGQPSHTDWLWFLLDKTYLRALPDVVDLGFARIEGLHGRAIDYLSGWEGSYGRGLMLIAYSLVYLVLLQGLARMWQIRRDVRDGITGVAIDPDMAVRLGRRAVKPLLQAWRAPEVLADSIPKGPGERAAPNSAQRQESITVVRVNILKALGLIGDPGALAMIQEAAIRHPEPEVREAGLLALGDLDIRETTEVLGRVLLDKTETAGARAAAAAALGRLTGQDAAEPLLTKLEEIHQIDKRYREDARVRKEVVRAVGRHLGQRRESRDARTQELIGRAVRNLLADGKNTSLLEDIYLRVRNKTAATLALLGDPRAVVPITERLKDPNFQNPKLLHDTALALGRLLGTSKEAGGLDEGARDAALAALCDLLQNSPNDSVRQSAARALGMSGSVEMLELLIQQFKAALKSGQEELATALKAGTCTLAPAQRGPLSDLEKRIGRRWSQRRRQVLLDGTRGLPERLGTARELGEYKDERGLKALEITADNPDTPTELREACELAMRSINDPKK